MGPEDEITITLNKGSSPVLITGEPTIVRAVLDALGLVLEGAPRRHVLQLAREARPRPGESPIGGAR